MPAFRTQLPPTSFCRIFRQWSIGITFKFSVLSHRHLSEHSTLVNRWVYISLQIMILKHEFPLLHFSVLLVSNNLISICCHLSLSDLVIVDADTSFAQFDLLLTHQDVNHLIVSPKVHRYGCGCALADFVPPISPSTKLHVIHSFVWFDSTVHRPQFWRDCSDQFVGYLKTHITSSSPVVYTNITI